MTRSILLLTLIATSAMAPPSQACRVFLPPAERLENGYERGAISAVALVTVTHAKHIGPPSGDAHPWRASAVVERVVSGFLPGKQVSFVRGYGSAACHDGHPLPLVGERWAVYFWKPAGGAHQVWQSYPAKVAREADPRLKKPYIR